MPKSNAKSSVTLISQIGAIFDEIEKADEALAQLVAHAKRLEALQDEVSETVARRNAQSAEILSKAKSGVSQPELVEKLRAVDKSASVAHLKLQSQMQKENRAFTSVSNVLKKRHDTLKNAIGNIR